MPGAVRPGNIIKKPTSVTPSGYLKCNGGVVSKSSYGELYAAVGDQFNKLQMTNGNGQPWRLQAGFNTSQSGDITGWSSVALTDGSAFYAYGTNLRFKDLNKTCNHYNLFLVVVVTINKVTFLCNCTCQ